VDKPMVRGLQSRTCVRQDRVEKWEGKKEVNPTILCRFVVMCLSGTVWGEICVVIFEKRVEEFLLRD
jgi:hypothetical protein